MMIYLTNTVAGLLKEFRVFIEFEEFREFEEFAINLL